MPYITFTAYPDVPGRQYRNAKTDVDGVTVSEVDEVRDGETEITEADHAAFTPAPDVEPEPVPPPPDPNAFKLAAYGYLGAEAFVMPLAGYIAPVVDALNARNWSLARQIVGYALTAQALTEQQYDVLGDLMADHGIPEA